MMVHVTQELEIVAAHHVKEYRAFMHDSDGKVIRKDFNSWLHLVMETGIEARVFLSSFLLIGQKHPQESTDDEAEGEVCTNMHRQCSSHYLNCLYHNN